MVIKGSSYRAHFQAPAIAKPRQASPHAPHAFKLRHLQISSHKNRGHESFGMQVFPVDVTAGLDDQGMQDTRRKDIEVPQLS